MNNDAGVVETETSYSALSAPELAVKGSGISVKLVMTSSMGFEQLHPDQFRP
jgi:hypothetical protein